MLKYSEIRKALTAKRDYFFDTHLSTTVRSNFTRGYKDDILLVCHADTVFYGDKYPTSLSKGKIISGGLDDRLGIAIAQHVSPKLGTSVLITDNEEAGQSTARYVNREILDKYSVIIELDRQGLGYVDYGLSCEGLDEILRELKIKKEYGSYSDICDLDTSTARINLGIGYHAQHSAGCWALMTDIQKAVHSLESIVRNIRARGERYETEDEVFQDVFQDDFQDDYGIVPRDGGTPYEICDSCGDGFVMNKKSYTFSNGLLCDECREHFQC